MFISQEMLGNNYPHTTFDESILMIEWFKSDDALFHIHG